MKKIGWLITCQVAYILSITIVYVMPLYLGYRDVFIFAKQREPTPFGFWTMLFVFCATLLFVAMPYILAFAIDLFYRVLIWIFMRSYDDEATVSESLAITIPVLVSIVGIFVIMGSFLIKTVGGIFLRRYNSWLQLIMALVIAVVPCVGYIFIASYIGRNPSLKKLFSEYPNITRILLISQTCILAGLMIGLWFLKLELWRIFTH